MSTTPAELLPCQFCGGDLGFAGSGHRSGCPTGHGPRRTTPAEPVSAVDALRESALAGILAGTIAATDLERWMACEINRLRYENWSRRSTQSADSALLSELERMRDALTALASDEGFPYLTNSEKLRQRISFARSALSTKEG